MRLNLGIYVGALSFTGSIACASLLPISLAENLREFTMNMICKTVSITPSI
ncbi:MULTISPECIES: hypothetical protein [unclassified Mycolicibacterium]|uniref:hypothetical protein n=1 Tax=unclassified Mycolicibacterium TaxID=2636767 RepID=UPI0012DC4367|nr:MULTISPECIES: hypothetical protein [unclassified Mycolicibacterium]